ncbi:hypothetical protein ACQEVM_18280 [Streptomyces sp. CA-243310]|uniref:hypothetical protein n=1 Tax=Streptomyces sp. CA-243310 TaxID=3240056 RepID=UPI003D8C02AD
MLRSLNNRSAFISPSHRSSDARARLTHSPDWSTVEEVVPAGLGLDKGVEEHLAQPAQSLDA